MTSRLAASALSAVLLLAACKSSEPKNYIEFHAGQDPLTIGERMADNVGRCWFDGKHATFDGYAMSPELSSPTRPRVLLIAKADERGLPGLVIEIIKAKRGSDVRLFGPLMATDAAASIRDDVRKWTGGERNC